MSAASAYVAGEFLTAISRVPFDFAPVAIESQADGRTIERLNVAAVPALVLRPERAAASPIDFLCDDRTVAVALGYSKTAASMLSSRPISLRLPE